jgi:hypothetical protein
MVFAEAPRQTSVSSLLHHPLQNGAIIRRKYFLPESTIYGVSTDPKQDAIASLNTLQSNFAVVDAIRKSGRKMNEQAIPEMIEWLGKIGYQVCDCESST